MAWNKPPRNNIPNVGHKRILTLLSFHKNLYRRLCVRTHTNKLHVYAIKSYNMALQPHQR